MIRNGLRLAGMAATLARYRLDDLLAGIPPLGFARAVRWLPWGKRGVRELSRGHRLRLALQDLGPIYVKFGQIISTRRDLLPADIADHLAGLQDDVPPFDSDQARAIIERELKAPVDELFDEFDDAPLASASIAQVHAARLKDGRSVVVKVVRPGIEKQVRRDIDLLRSLARLIRRYHPEGERIRPDDIVAEFERVIVRELDMRAEAASATLLKNNFEHSADLYIPEIHWSLTARKVLVMEHVRGVPAGDIEQLKARGVDLGRLARRCIRIFYGQVFRDNLFHADMHPGNLLVDVSRPDDPGWIALDFGIVESLTPTDLYYIGENFLAIFNRDYRRVAELHVEAGWVPADTRIDELTAAARTVGEPNFTRPLEEVSFAEMVMELFSVARQFKLTLQPQLIMLQKTLLNIEGMSRQLDPRINIWEVAKPELEAIFADRYGFSATAKNVARRLPVWLSQTPEMPELIRDFLKAGGQGRLSGHIHSEDLDRLAGELGRHNRRLPGAILAGALVISGAVLAGFQVAPLFGAGNHSVPAIVAVVLGAVAGWRSWRAR